VLAVVIVRQPEQLHLGEGEGGREKGAGITCDVN